MHTAKPYRVRAVRCDHRASDEEVYDALRRVADPLTAAWRRLAAAGRVLVKPNAYFSGGVRRFEGRNRELVDDAVLRALLRLLRERTRAEVLVIDDSPPASAEATAAPGVAIRPVLAEFDVAYRSASDPPAECVDVPGGGSMFDRYLLSSAVRESDAVVSLAKMKNHAFMGVTLCLKNLFGLPAWPPAGRVRTYYHHFIRLPHVLVDLGRIVAPCLNVIDALTGQAGREWDGEGRICSALVAGDHPVATDACGAYLMGHEPATDWPAPPFRTERNALRLAAGRGFGTVDLEAIDFASECEAPLAAFDSRTRDTAETIRSWRRTTCEQALFYREHRAELTARYPGEYIFLQDGHVVWHGAEPWKEGSRRGLSGGQRDHALWLKFADPDEAEGEHFEVYEETLRAL
ncbi:MAG: DUF362 domain-containing protein [Kiritimatiellae bacterium]|nr:DUF362 domain-containing protein [Kiritimatiellia bacterium]